MENIPSERSAAPLIIQYALDKWNPHGTKENGSTYQMLNLTNFRENGSITNNKKEK